METQTVTLSKLLQHSGEVLPATEQGGIVVQRRGAPSLLMMELDQWDALATFWRATIAAYKEILSECHCRTEQRALEASMPWLSLMKKQHQQECIEELTRVTQAVLESGRFSELAETIASWRMTALALWDEDRNRDRKGYDADEPIVVEDF